MKLHLLFFAGLKDFMGTPERTHELAAAQQTAEGLLAELALAYPGLRLDGVRVAVNEEFVSLDARLHEHDVVALIPPVSGG